jgi:Ca-activated chloride channel family protein
LYSIFLLPAVLLFFLVYFPFRLKKIQPVVAALLIIFVSALADTGVPAAYAAEAEAYAAYRNHNPALAQTLYADVQGYAGRMGEGAAAYRRKDYQYAIKQFSAALLESRAAKQRELALFNLGNSYFIAGNYRAAADAFLGVAEMAKTGKKTQGILGRRGRETGGDLGEDASDKPVSLEADDEKKIKSLASGSELAQGEIARLRSKEKQASSDNSFATADSDSAYRAALKKLELATDNPVALHKALVKLEAAREYVPQAEMSPW